jgi:hypothetical protein
LTREAEVDGGWGTVEEDPTLVILGTPLDIKIRRSLGKMLAYVTSSTCDDVSMLLGGMGGMVAMGDGEGEPPGPPHCRVDPECGGGGGGTPRSLLLSVVDVSDPSTVPSPTTVVLSITAVGCTTGDNAFQMLQNVGMDLTVDGSNLLVANPDRDWIDVLDTETNTLGSSILIGDRPTDVVITETLGLHSQERAYIASRGDHTVRIIRVEGDGTLTPLPTEFIQLAHVDDPNPETLQPVAITARSDGARIFTADLYHQTVTVANIDPQSAFENQRYATIDVRGIIATRVVALSVPEAISECGNSICERGEDCTSCTDCAMAPACGNGVCEAANGENCWAPTEENPFGCPSDCKRAGSGPPSKRCCGENGKCENSECSEPPYQCVTDPVAEFCCGDELVEPGEGDGEVCDGNH